MRIVRTAAQKISLMVVRYASPGCVGWAEGLAREGDFIKSDWAALLWAMGSMRVLLDRRPSPIHTYDDLVPVIEKFVQQRQIYSWYWVIMLMQFCLALPKIFRAGSILQHTGNAMVSTAWFFLTIESFRLMWERRSALRSKDHMDVIRYYKRDLQSQVDFYRSSKGRGSILMLLLFFSGFEMSDPGIFGHGLGLILGCLLLLLVLFLLYTRRNARRRLQELDALLESKS